MSERPQTQERAAAATAPRRGWQLVLGPALIAVAWPAYWSVTGRYSEDLFLPLWLGYIVTVDGLVRLRTGASLLTGRVRLFLLLLPASCAFWFFYELYNHVLGNWRYQAHQRHGRLVWDLVQAVLITTVIPALWETRELFRSFPRLAGLRGVRLPASRRALRILSALGLLALVLPLLLPRQTYPLVWCGLFLLLDPLNRLRGLPSVLGEVADGRWGEVAVLTLTGFTTGFFWEFWNGGSAGYRWVYDVPYFNTWPHLFEMPLPGYLGYPPFAFSAYAFTVLLIAAFRLDRTAPRTASPL
ncbi:hypothetical protein [Kitasatospora sp. MAA4]|uniref:hypothetical protein n=1 Tax=Kitasatospora sp. MAA4 TaxID=3035093 RepID=UPI002475DC20|nr:hypothetical protein [Kitasatospora sp. MAA4]